MSSRHLEHTPFTPVRWRWSGVSFKCLLIIPRVHGKYLVFQQGKSNGKWTYWKVYGWFGFFLQNVHYSVFFHNLYVSIYIYIDYLGTPQHWKVVWTSPILKGKDHGFQASFFRGFCCKFVCWGSHLEKYWNWYIYQGGVGISISTMAEKFSTPWNFGAG